MGYVDQHADMQSPCELCDCETSLFNLIQIRLAAWSAISIHLIGGAELIDFLAYLISQRLLLLLLPVTLPD